MSKQGLEAVRALGLALPTFKSLEGARAFLCTQRDERLAKLKAIAADSKSFIPDATPESLKKMELWYFQLIESEGFCVIGVPREDFEKLMAAYFCQVAVANCPGAEWHVAEFAFEKGKYEIGVKCGLFQFMRGSFADHYARKSNRTRSAIYREYQRYFVSK